MWHVLSVGAKREGRGFTMNLCFHSWSVSRMEPQRHSRSSRPLCSHPPFVPRKLLTARSVPLTTTISVVSGDTNINTQQHQHTHHTSAWRCRLTEPVKSALLLGCEILESCWFSISSVDVKLRVSFELFLRYKPCQNLYLKKASVWRKSGF